MRTYFETVIQLDASHAYYEDKVCKALEFVPTGSCIALFKKFRLVYKKTASGFILAGEKKNTGTDAAPVLIPRIDIPAGTKFYFFITHLRNDFLNITNADMTRLSEGRKYCFMNPLTAPVVSGGKATFKIHDNAP